MSCIKTIQQHIAFKKKMCVDFVSGLDEFEKQAFSFYRNKLYIMLVN